MVAEQRAPVGTDVGLDQLVADHVLLLRPGTYPAVLVAVDVVDAEEEDDDDDFGGWSRPSQFWSFRIDLGHGRMVLVDRPRSGDDDDDGIPGWASALLGRATAVPPNEEERAELVGRACTVTVRLRRWGTGRVGQRRPTRLELPDLDCRLDVPDDDPWLVWSSEIVKVAPRDIC